MVCPQWECITDITFRYKLALKYVIRPYNDNKSLRGTAKMPTEKCVMTNEAVFSQVDVVSEMTRFFLSIFTKIGNPFGK
jgi:hypothetical protein